MTIWWPYWICVDISLIPKTISLDFYSQLTICLYYRKISRKFLLQFFSTSNCTLLLLIEKNLFLSRQFGSLELWFYLISCNFHVTSRLSFTALYCKSLPLFVKTKENVNSFCPKQSFKKDWSFSFKWWISVGDTSFSNFL